MGLKTFENYLVENGIKHRAVPPLHPAANGELIIAETHLQCTSLAEGNSICAPNNASQYHRTPSSGTDVQANTEDETIKTAYLTREYAREMHIQNTGTRRTWI